MKTRKFFGIIFGIAALLIGFVSCEKDEPTSVSISLDKTTTSIEVGKTVEITATVSPEGTASFASSNESIAKIITTEGNVATVEGMAAGTAMITATYSGATTTCAVTVTSGGSGELHASLQGSDYYIIALDAISSEAIAGKIIADYRPDDESKCLFIWEETYVSNTPSGKNCYGSTETWYSLEVQSVGWSGLGQCVGSDPLGNVVNPEQLDAMAEVYNNYSDYTLHIAMKGKQGVPYLFGFDGNMGTGRVVLGPEAFVDGSNEYEPYSDYTNDGSWNHFDIPVSYLVEQGWAFSTGNTTKQNILFVLAGGQQGTKVDYDAIFFYKKAQ